MDALAHCLEAYCAPAWHPMAEGIAVEGMRLVKDALPRAYADGTDLEARGMMLAAAAMGATAFQKGLGAIHSLSHPIGAALRHPSRPDQRRRDALRAGLQPHAIEAKIERLAGLARHRGRLRWLSRLDPGPARRARRAAHAAGAGRPHRPFRRARRHGGGRPDRRRQSRSLWTSPAPTGCWPRPIPASGSSGAVPARAGRAATPTMHDALLVDSLWVLLTRLVMRAANFAVFLLLARSLSGRRVRLLRLRHVDRPGAGDRLRSRACASPAPG